MHASRASHVGSIGYSARLAVSIMLITLLLFLVSAVTIYLACEYFVNGIEWTGHHFKLSQSATGSLLAALGTALPECIVTLTALLMGNTTAQQEIGIGAALGGPLVLATIGYAAVGLTLLLCIGRTERAIDGEVQREIGRDQRWFIGIFLVATALGLVAFIGKSWLAPLFLLVYLVYVRRELKQSDSHEVELPEPLKLAPDAGIPPLGKVLLQTLAALVVVALAAQLFVHQLESMGELFGLSPVLAALLLSPVATGDAGADERADLGATGQEPAGAGQYLRSHDDPGHHPQGVLSALHPLAAGWRHDGLLAGDAAGSGLALVGVQKGNHDRRAVGAGRSALSRFLRLVAGELKRGYEKPLGRGLCCIG